MSNYVHQNKVANHADCFKHALLFEILSHLHSNIGISHYIESHAGAGRYSLQSISLNGKSPEWKNGIKKIMAVPGVQDISFFAYATSHYRQNLDYIGSPLMAAQLLHDATFIFHEKDELVARTLDEHLQFMNPETYDVRIVDSWLTHVFGVQPCMQQPVLFIDPPYKREDFKKIEECIKKSFAQNEKLIILLWYPIFSGATQVEISDFLGAITALKMPHHHYRCVVANETDETKNKLLGSGMIILNYSHSDLDAKLQKMSETITNILR
jgi:23S rRNA (adenine2030-N6)-methyltransferase